MITQDTIEQKAAELSQELNIKVHPLMFIEQGTDEVVQGYLREPDRVTKTRYLDRAVTSLASAAGELLEVCLIKEHSDERIMKNDNHYFGACAFVNQLVQASQNQIAKKK